MRRAMLLLTMSLYALLVPSHVVGGDEVVRVVGITPGHQGDMVVCHLQTAGLPEEKQLQSMRSGLVSSVEIDLALLDEDNRFLGGRTMILRLAFDLWEEVFSVRDGGHQQRFHSLNDLEEYLADLGNLPVATFSSLDQSRRYRLRVGLMVHSIAPDEKKRVEEVIAGDHRSHREGQDQQEASVSLGRLIRFFYKDGHNDREGGELLSGWFTSRGLDHESN